MKIFVKWLCYGAIASVTVVLCAILGMFSTPLKPSTVQAQTLAVPAERLTPTVNESNTNTPESTTAETAPELGWEFLGQRELNHFALKETEYYGECPGYKRRHIKASFTSSETPPADRRRVVVRNITRGVDDDPFPYTDREYYEGRSSEATKMRFGDEHSGRYFHVLPGENMFEYEIKQRRRGPVIDSGTFTATIDRDLTRIERNATFGKDRVCANTSVSVDVCADVRDREKWECPNGKILRSEIFPDDPWVRTQLHNRTDHTISVSINGRMTRIFPGSYEEFHSDYPSVRYESNGERRSRSLTSGTRYRLYERDGKLRVGEYRGRSGW